MIKEVTTCHHLPSSLVEASPCPGSEVLAPAQPALHVLGGDGYLSAREEPELVLPLTCCHCWLCLLK